MRGARAALWLAALVSGCGLSARAGEHPQRDQLAQRWHYEIAPDEELEQIEAKLCFEGAVPDELRAGKDDAASHLRYARWLSPGAIRKLPVHNGRIQLDSSARDACIAYGVSLAGTTRSDSVLRRAGRDVVASPNVWLWRPQKRHPRATATLTLELPREMRAFLPWPRQGGRYELDARAFRFDSYAAFGAFTPQRFIHASVTVEVAAVAGGLELGPDALERWLRRAVDVVTIEGRVPARELRVLVVPTDSPREPVPFGMVARGGSGSVLLFVDRSAPERALKYDWVLPHELSHLWLPFVDEAWLSEGFATYMQEVLRARAGVFSPEAGLANLARGMRSARTEGTGRSMSHESQDMHRTYAYRSVYWAGAAFFLLADVELRRKSAGAISLDDVLLALHERGDHAKVWQAEALLARMDELSGHVVFVPLARRCLSTPFPDVEPALTALGANVVDGQTVVTEEAPLSALRAALFSPRN